MIFIPFIDPDPDSEFVELPTLTALSGRPDLLVIEAFTSVTEGLLHCREQGFSPKGVDFRPFPSLLDAVEQLHKEGLDLSGASLNGRMIGSTEFIEAMAAFNATLTSAGGAASA